MRSHRVAFLVLFILFMLSIPIALSPLNVAGVSSNTGTTRVLSPSGSDPYSENLQLYLTSSEAFWRIDMIGGNISVSSLSIPASVSGYSITLTHYNTWKTQFELFGKYGYGLLGSGIEPNPNGAFLQINSSSSSDAQALANSLSLRFALDFAFVSEGSGTYLYFSPSNFLTEVHVFFWGLVPTSYKGFATIFSEQQFESNVQVQIDLLYYQLSYSNSNYRVSLGELTPLVGSNFKLYSQMGLVQSKYNYSSSASSSKIGIHVLGGLISNSSVPSTNYQSNFSASMYTSNQGSAATIPNINATLDLSFPTILAYRQVSSLTPSHNQNVSVSIVVTNVSPSGYPTASSVSVNDSWIYSQKNAFQLTIPQTTTKQNLSSSGTFTDAYAFTVLASNGTFNLPATPVTYQFIEGNKTIMAQALLNPETLVVGGQNSPQLEATEALSSGAQQAGQTSTFNVTVANKGSGIAFNVKSAGLTKADLPSGQTWSFLTNTSSSSLTQTNASISYQVSWSDSSNKTHTTVTNTVNAIFSFATPATPGLQLIQSLNYFQSKSSGNVTLMVFDRSTNTASNISISGSLPPGAVFAKSYNSTSLRFSNGVVSANVTSLEGNSNKTFIFSVNLTSTSQNYIFLPANVSSVWNGILITHQSAGYILPLGVQATKQINPTQDFQGSNVSLTISLTNRGSLPIYFVSLNDTSDSFLRILKSNSSYQALVRAGESMSPAHLVANLTGQPGSYNSSGAAASFIISGYNETASSSSFVVTIYHVAEANLTSSASKYEEGHDITITESIFNPSNVTINNVVFTLELPSGLALRSGGQTNFMISSLGPGQSMNQNFQVITNQPNVYRINSTALTFQYQGTTLKGIAGTLSLNLQDDLTTRYAIPIVIAILIALGSIFYVRRLIRRTSVVPPVSTTPAKKK